MAKLKTATMFQEKGYCIVENAISNDLRDVITQYSLFDEMQDFAPDPDQVVGAHAKYADPAMEALLLHIHPIMEKNTGLKLFPTYSFYRVYRRGDELTKHIDRPSCEISCTMTLNYSYDTESYQWPIYMDGYEANLKPGDMVIYRGCDLPHWRDPMNPPNENDWHVQAFFHYVDQNGPYPEYKFDRRESLGITPKMLERQTKSYILYT